MFVHCIFIVDDDDDDEDDSDDDDDIQLNADICILCIIS